jgi:4-hydroxyphenylacetate 3-monooxygenase
MGARTGKEYLERLAKEGPEVWLGEERVRDVTAHPALREAAFQIARLYDLQHQEPYRGYMLFPSPTTGDPVGTQFLLPRSPEDLERRRRMHKTWADATYGLMGRTTDFLSAQLTGWYISADYFAPYSENVKRYFEYIRENDLFLTHALANPAFDRTRPPSQQADPFLVLGAVRETERGIVVRGAKMIATAGPYADEILVWSFSHSQYTEETAPYALAFAIPTNSPGLKFICREPYGGGDRFDHPLASRYDEMDTVAIFDDVLVPWDRIFIYRDPDKVNNIYKTAMAAFSAHQTAVRLLSKLEFAAALARYGAKMLKVDQFLHVQDMIGEITTYAELTRAGILAAEAGAKHDAQGYLIPDKKPLVAVRNAANRWYPRVREILQLVFAGHLMYLPASDRAFASPIREYVEKYYQGAGVSAKERTRLLRAVADLAVHSFGGRHELYERFYAGDPIRLRAAQQYLGYDWSEANEILRRLLEELELPAREEFGLKPAERDVLTHVTPS